jgi:NAD(P)H-dependent FMN reductase
MGGPRTFRQDYFSRPAVIVCYARGAFGGVRAAMQLRMTLAELGMSSIPSIFPAPKAHDAFTEDGTSTDSAMERRIGRFIDELQWYAWALEEARAKGLPY